MLISKGKITEDLIEMLLNWRHSGFNGFCGPRIHPREEAAMENLARYIIRASFPQEGPPGATGFSVLGLDYALFQIWLCKYTGLVIGLGQGMTYLPDESTVVYGPKVGKSEKAFNALDWIAPCAPTFPQ